MTTPMTRAVATICLLAVAQPGLTGEALELSKQQVANMGIELGHPEPASAVQAFQAPGQVTIPPSQEYVVSSQQAGLVKVVNAAEGQAVSAGEVLARVKSPDLLGAQRDFLNALSEYRLARQQLNRDRQLFEEGIIAERRLESTRAQYQRAETALAERRQLLTIAGMTPEAIDRLQRTRELQGTLAVRAPVAGVVLEKLVKAGERVTGADPLYRVANLERLWLELRVPQERVGEIQTGASVEVTDCDVTGRVTEIGSRVDAENQTVLVRAEVRGGDDVLRPGQFISVRIATARTGHVYRVPARAIVRRAGQPHVFVRTSQGFEPRPVTVVGGDASGTAISEGVGPDDQIAVKGIAALKGVWMGLGGRE